MTDMSSRLKQLLIEYKYILIKDGMVSSDELMEMLRLDEEMCLICNNDENKLDRVCKIILKQAEEGQAKKYVNLEQNYIDEVKKERMILYEKGLSDVEIAKIQGVHLTTIYAWRGVNGLDPNPTKTDKINSERLMYYHQGMTDAEIADKTDSSYNAIREWRRRNKLPINRGRKNDRRTEKVS